MTLGDHQQHSDLGSFRSLPLELRQIIYRHLLIPIPVVKIKRQIYDFEPAILLLNKEFHEEASWVLYKENDWVLLCIDASFRTFQEGWQLEDEMQRYPIVPLAESNFTQKPCLEVEIRKMNAKARDAAGRNLRRFIVLLDGLPRVCQILTAARSTSSFEVGLNFEEVKTNAMEKIMDCLEDVCGYGNLVVKGLDAAATQKAIIKFKKPEPCNSGETLERITRYEARISRHIAQGRYIQAMTACQDGMAYINFLFESMSHERFGPLGPSYAMFPLRSKFTELALQHARCCLNLGDSQSARQILHLFLTSQRSRSLYQEDMSYIIEAHFCNGKSMVASGAENAAAFSFIRVLLLDSSHYGANKELDAMEARLALRRSDGEDGETFCVRHNLQKFSNCRHNKRQVTLKASELLSGFLPSGKELDLWKVRQEYDDAVR